MIKNFSFRKNLILETNVTSGILSTKVKACLNGLAGVSKNLHEGNKTGRECEKIRSRERG